jgi:hypothetical protein
MWETVRDTITILLVPALGWVMLVIAGDGEGAASD